MRGLTRSGAMSILVALLVAGPGVPGAFAQAQSVDQGLQAQNAGGKGTDLLKVGWFLLTKVFLPISGIALAAVSIVRGFKKGEWFDSIVGVAGGLLLALLPAVVGYVMNVDLYQLFQ